jgi:hypothetical protein
VAWPVPPVEQGLNVESTRWFQQRFAKPRPDGGAWQRRAAHANAIWVGRAQQQGGIGFQPIANLTTMASITTPTKPCRPSLMIASFRLLAHNHRLTGEVPIASIPPAEKRITGS